MPKDDPVIPKANSQQPIAVAVPDDMTPPPMVDPTSVGSAAPVNDVLQPAMETTPITGMSPKKKFAGGKVIATILGLFLLVGGIGAGVLLVGQNQNPEERASHGACGEYDNPRDCGNACSPNGYECTWSSANLSCRESSSRCDGGGGGGGTPVCSNQCTLGARLCQEDDNGKNTGYNCTCIDLSSATQCIHDWRCTDFDTRACPIEGGGGGSGAEYCVGSTCGIPAGLAGCYVNHYVSDNKDDTTVTDPYRLNVGSATLGAQNCGAEQIDVQCAGGTAADGLIYDACTVGSTAGCSISVRHETDCGENPAPTSPPGATPSPSPAPITAQCQNVKAYSETWTLLTDTQLSALETGDDVNFCVAGVATGGSFDRARFTINNVLQPETTTVRPTSTDFCHLYTIPAGTTAFNVTAEIHHVTLGWK